MPHPRDAITALLLLNTDRINLVMVICGILFYSRRRVVLSWATLFHALLVVDLIYQVLGWWHILTVGCHREQGHCFTRVSKGKVWSRIILLQRNVSWTDKWKHVIPENLISYNCKIAFDDKRRCSDAREIIAYHWPIMSFFLTRASEYRSPRCTQTRCRSYDRVTRELSENYTRLRLARWNRLGHYARNHCNRRWRCLCFMLKTNVGTTLP